MHFLLIWIVKINNGSQLGTHAHTHVAHTCSFTKCNKRKWMDDSFMFKCYLIAVSSYVIGAVSWPMYCATFFHISCTYSHQYTHINTLAQSNVHLVNDSHTPFTHIHACTNALTHRHIRMRKSTYVSVRSRSTFYQVFEVFVACGGCNCRCVLTNPWMLIDIRLPRLHQWAVPPRYYPRETWSIFYLWNQKVSGNEKSGFVYDVFSHWLVRP